MHARVDLSLILCALGFHDEIRVAEQAIYPARRVILRRCLRCSRHLQPRGTPRPSRIDPTPPSPSRYS